VERLMRQAGLTGVVRGKRVRNASSSPGGERAGDRVNWDFTDERWGNDDLHRQPQRCE
jgi:putative transposase